MGGDVGIAVFGQQIAHGGALVKAVLQQQPAAGFQVAGRTGGQLAQGGEAVAKIGKGGLRLKAQVTLLQMRIGRVDWNLSASQRMPLPAEGAR